MIVIKPLNKWECFFRRTKHLYDLLLSVIVFPIYIYYFKILQLWLQRQVNWFLPAFVMIAVAIYDGFVRVFHAGPCESKLLNNESHD